MKRGIKKTFIYFAVFMGVLMLSGVFAESVGLSDNVKEIVNNIVEKQGINKGDIQSVEKVSLDNLPSQVDLKNIDTTNLAVYQVDYGGDRPVYVITATGETIKASVPKTFSYKMLLNFGANGQVSAPTFLNTANGVEGNLEKGYVMVRDGSITGWLYACLYSRGPGKYPADLCKKNEHEYPCCSVIYKSCFCD